MSLRRDNFSEKTRTQISRLAGGLCAYPGCQAATFGATSDGSGVLDIGIAAHICAAAPGGPRYDESMSQSDRSSAANGIWMCADHGRAIDADPKFFTVEKLRQWKRDAEHAAFLRVTRHPVPLNVPTLSVDLYKAARADLDVLRATSKWPSSSIALTLKIDGFDEPMTTWGLAAAAQQIEDLTITAPPGMGKTTTLLQIAASVLDEGHGAPVFVQLGDWASEGRTILASILARSTFATISEDMFRAVAATGAVVLLLDGWNELDTEARTRARIELERLKAEYPTLAMVVSTRRQALDVPLTGKRVDLLPLGDSQQIEIARALAGDAGAALLDRAWRTPGVRDLVEIPLYLTVLLSLGDASFPETKEELLRRFVSAHEGEPRRAEVLLRDAKGFQQVFLGDLAAAATRSANTAISDTEARRALNTSVTALIDDGQISLKIDPGSLLGTLIDNTVLVWSSQRSAVAFQHQQFQEWFASHEVEKRMLDAAASASAMQLFQESILDLPAWEEPILFAIERMSRGADHQQKACAAGILAAFHVDPMLAAEMIFRTTDDVWRRVERSIVGKVDRWHDPNKAGRALRFMMLTGRSEFLDRIWPLISDPDEQRTLRSLRVSPGLRPAILGTGAADRLRSLPASTRSVILGELAMDGGPDALDLATEVAESDPDPEVQNRVIEGLSFRYADRHLARLLKRVSDIVLERAVERGLPLPVADDNDLRDRLRAAKARLKKREGPLDALRGIAFGHRQDPDPKTIRGLVANVEAKGMQDPATSIVYQAHSLYPREVAEGLLDRVRANKPVFYRAGDLIASAAFGFEDDSLLAIALQEGDRSDRAEAAASALGPGAAGKIVDAYVNLSTILSDRSKPYDEVASGRRHTLKGRLGRVPGKSVADAIEQRADTADAGVVARYAQLLSWHAQDEGDRSRPFDAEAVEKVRGLAARWGERLLASGAERSDVADIATLISNVPDIRFLDLLRRMLDNELQLYAGFRAAAEAAAWRQSDAVNEARSSLTHIYERAFRAIDDPATRSVMLEYLEDHEFGECAARVLSEQWVAANRPPPLQRFGGGVDFSHVAERRAQTTAHPAATTNEAEAILAVVERLLETDANDATVARAVLLATIAAQMPHGGHEETFRVLVERAPLRIRARLVLAMILSGDAVGMDVIERGISETFDAANKEPWILTDSNAWRLRDWLQLLPFASDLSRLVSIIEEIPEQHRRDDRLETMIAGLGATPSPGAERGVFGLAALQPSLYRNHSWSSTVLDFDTDTALEALIELIAAGIKVGTRSTGSWTLLPRIGEDLRDHPDVRDRLLRRLKGSDMSDGHRTLALALGQLPDIEAVDVLIELENSWKVALVDYRAVQNMVTEQIPEPEWNNAYTIVPKAAVLLRRRLLHLTSDGTRTDRAAVILGWIDQMRDEYGRALEEPRHPHLASGKSWPILVHNDEAMAD